MNELTIHMVVRNEPLVYYAVKAVYQDADEILLYDTGSTDYTLSDIGRLMCEDVDDKIRFKSVPIEADQTGWTYPTMQQDKESWKDKFGVTDVRQMQIDVTKTPFFLVVDGDEVHYKGAMKSIKESLPSLNGHVWAKIPYYRFPSMGTLYGGKKMACRLFKTDSIFMNGVFPEDIHCIKGLGKLPDTPEYSVHLKHIAPYAHFEMMLKPTRRPVIPEMVRPCNRILPEVMVKEPFYIQRLLNGFTNS